MFDEIIFDIETQKLFEDINFGNIAKLGVSVVCLYKRTLDKDYHEISGHMHTFWQNDLSSMWSLFANVNRVIGFNSIDFDNLVLRPLCSTYDFSKLNHFDILKEIQKILGHRLSLNTIARSTLNETKIDSGINAVKYWQKGDSTSLAKLSKYCQADVLITKKIYDFALKNKYLKYIDKWNTLKSVELDFSYHQDQYFLI